uniref:Transcription factor LHW-like isoform X1 n=1 Tax=Rhizophora mucronata TaxID=61149 RepID=A0A2P2JLL4_RHIMU
MENPDLPVGDQQYWGSDVHSSLLGIQGSNRVHLLVKKMMMNDQVNVVGEGLVGRAAFTGNPEWILAGKYNADVHPPEVSNEVHQQFLAGMQTVAIIPVFPHGVVQLGSLLAIMENMGFVNNVKSLILQLGCVPGVLLSDNYAARESTERIRPQVSSGMPISKPLMQSTPLLVNGCNQQCSSSLASRFVGQPSHSLGEQTQDCAQSTFSTFHTPNMTNNLAKSHAGHSELEMKPGDHFKGHLQKGVVGAQVIPTNPDKWLNQHAASHNARPGLCCHPVIGQSDSNSGIQKLPQQQFSSDAVAQNHVCDNKDASQSLTVPHMRTNGSPLLNSHAVSLPSGMELLNRVSGHTGLSSIPCSVSNPQNMTDINHFSANLAGVGPQGFVSSGTQEVTLSSLGDQLSGSGMLSGSSDHNYFSLDAKHSKHELITSEEKMDNNPFQAFNSTWSIQPGRCVTLSEHNSNSLPDFLEHESGIQSITATNAIYEDSFARPRAGDDLYDILGVDFKNKLLSGKGNSVLEGGPYPKAEITAKDTSTIMNVQEMNPDVYSVNERATKSSIFSAADADNLLDAVVSKAHPAVKQSLDDNISCRTSLTKISSSSVLSDAPTLGYVNVSDQPKKGLLEIYKSREKAGSISSHSILSGCTKDSMKSCSQTTSVYGSQLSSWVEQAHNVRRESSVATGYSKKNAEVSKTDRKKLKPGENPRPRPKDRQMIQDRVKELREIVPNGAKCSIDALLERTIKHMLFLQSVTKHADKLKQTGEAKIINKEGGVLVKDNFEGGATWAFEVGSQSMVCPIIVEDLNPPRQMLVEMLCEERGFFLEIADLIRGLGLTILKGVMEAQNDKIWARFAVEANRDVTRMEIFMSLVHLLEQTMKDSTSAVNALSNSAMIHQAFPQAAFIPASGGPSSLQ